MKTRLWAGWGRTSATTSFILLIMALATSAFAGQPSGTAHVEAVDTTRRTVVLKGETYKVTSATALVGKRGGTASLAELRPIPTGATFYSSEDVDAVRWSAVETVDGWVLEELRILEELPD